MTNLGENWALKSFRSAIEYQMKNLVLVDFLICYYQV